MIHAYLPTGTEKISFILLPFDRLVENQALRHKIEQELNFVVDDSRLLLDAQEAKKVSERTVVR